MTTSPSSAVSPRSAGPPRRALDVAYLLISLATLGACSDAGILEPNRSPMAGAGSHAAVVVTTSYSSFDTRAEFNGAGVIDHLNGFSDLTGDVMYILPTPWTTNGVTYTSALNIVFGPGIGMGVTSNALSTEFATPLTGQFAGDAFKLFGADLSLIGPKVPVSVVILDECGELCVCQSRRSGCRHWSPILRDRVVQPWRASHRVLVHGRRKRKRASDRRRRRRSRRPSSECRAGGVRGRPVRRAGGREHRALDER